MYWPTHLKSRLSSFAPFHKWEHMANNDFNIKILNNLCLFEFWELHCTAKFKWNLSLYFKNFLITQQARKPIFKEKKAVLRHTFAANYVVQGTWTTAGFYNNKPSMHKTNLLQIAIFLKKSNKPPNKEQTNKKKLIPVELSWFPEWLSFCHLYVLCFGKKNDACLLLADQEI